MIIFNYNLKTNKMRDLQKFAREGNADECFAILKEGLYMQSPHLENLTFKYENALIDDEEFCEAIDEYINF